MSQATNDRRDSQSEVFVLPLNLATYESFVKTSVKTVDGDDWFRGGKRVVIIDQAVEKDEKIRDFLKRYENEEWKIFPRGALRDNEPHLFRNFCVITTTAGKKTAYFTYLDKSHSNLFTKGSWSQYKTVNQNYIYRLESQFDYLWKNTESTPIRPWLNGGTRHSGAGI